MKTKIYEGIECAIEDTQDYGELMAGNDGYTLREKARGLEPFFIAWIFEIQASPS